MKFTRTIRQLSIKDTNIAGGKGAALGEMARIGIPVPKGFVVLTAAFERFIKETGIEKDITKALESVDTKKIDTIEKASKRIKNLIASKEMPADISEDIEKAFKRLNKKQTAVRSSATSEDSASAAWAGQLDSFLNSDKHNLISNIKRCWASLFNSRAIFYRFEKGMRNRKISVAVVVQEMVRAKKAGIAFSVHPVTGNRDHIIIEACHGTGEAIVSGRVTPESYVVDKKSMNITGIKNRVLDKKEIRKLAALIIRIEDHFGLPCDIEWAKDKRFYIVQSRPITSLKKHAEKNRFMLYRIRENALNPAYWNGVLITSDDIRKSYGTALKLQYFLFKDGRLRSYYLADDWARAAGYISKKVLRDKGFFQKICKNTEKARKKIQRWLSAGHYSGLSIESLIKKAKEIKALFMLYDAACFPAWYIAGDMLKKEIRGSVGLSDKEFDIISLPGKKTYVNQMETDILKSFLKDSKSAQKELARRYCWVTFGYDGPGSLDERYFKKRLDKLNRNSARKKLDRIRKKDQENRKLRKDISSRLTESQLRLIGIIQMITLWTDERKMLDFRLFYHYNEILKAIGRTAGVPLKNLKYLLTEELSKLDTEKERLIAESQKRIRDEFFLKVIHGSVAFGTDSEMKMFKEETGQEAKAGTIKGSVACRGKRRRYTARVKIILSPGDFKKLRKGDFLVATMTSPDYVLAMNRAAGFITDEGGVTCHAAISSREMGKPCIIGTKNATLLLNDNDVVEVDTDTGTVRKRPISR